MDISGIADANVAKVALRREAHRRRDWLHVSDRAEASRAACRHFLSSFPLEPDAVVAGYWPIRDELDIRTIMAQLMDAGQPVCLPVVRGEDQPLELRLWQSGAALYPAGFGTLAPEGGDVVDAPDVVLMPLLGFDDRGTRLGYGGGYYDRTLAGMARRPRLVGFAFSVQQFDHVPRLAHDIALDAVVTETGIRMFIHEDRTA